MIPKKKIQELKNNLSSSLHRILLAECPKEPVVHFPVVAGNSAGSHLTVRTSGYFLFSSEVFHSVLMLLNFDLHMTAKKEMPTRTYGNILVFKAPCSYGQIKVNCCLCLAQHSGCLSLALPSRTGQWESVTSRGIFCLTPCTW